MIVPDFDRKIVIVPSRVPSRILTGCPGPFLSHGKILSLSRCPVVPLSRENEGTFVSLFQKVALSRSVGNPCVEAFVKQSVHTLTKLLVIIATELMFPPPIFEAASPKLVFLGAASLSRSLMLLTLIVAAV